MHIFSHFSHFRRILLASRICHTRGSHIIKLAASPLHMRICCLAPFNCSSLSHFSLAFCHTFLASHACHTRSHIYPRIASHIFALLSFCTWLLFIFSHHYFYTARLLIYSPGFACSTPSLAFKVLRLHRLHRLLLGLWPTPLQNIIQFYIIFNIPAP
jgi:hypothetical protein